LNLFPWNIPIGNHPFIFSLNLRTLGTPFRILV
jgi:hypothetical protein